MIRTLPAPPDPDQLAAVDRDGHLILRNAVSPEIRDRFAEASLADRSDRLAAAPVELTPPGWIFHPALTGNGNQGEREESCG
ncbi:hypothetical protein ACF9IK_14750 [Kitasatospora hibisci]|uniref:hypothetical protein n=1 Tax=Kitasatospora hibisci TaxID=3369522 RepID=UPI0037545030